MKKHTAAETILYHLLPGIIQLLALQILLKPIGQRLGLSGELVESIDAFFLLAPLQFGILLYWAKKTSGTFQITKLMPYLEKSKLTEYLLFIIVIGPWALGVDALLTPIENRLLRDGLFAFVPEAIAMRNAAPTLLSAWLMLLSNGILAPVTEELYFRGFLLPRINLSPYKAAIANAVLFSLYHFFSPWYFFSRVLMTLPIYIWVIKRKNIRFSILGHIIANMTYSSSILFSLL